jgi:hypothetical protein
MFGPAYLYFVVPSACGIQLAKFVGATIMVHFVATAAAAGAVLRVPYAQTGHPAFMYVVSELLKVFASEPAADTNMGHILVALLRGGCQKLTTLQVNVYELMCAALSCAVLYCTILYCTVPCCNALHCTELLPWDHTVQVETLDCLHHHEHSAESL